MRIPGPAIALLIAGTLAGPVACGPGDAPAEGAFDRSGEEGGEDTLTMLYAADERLFGPYWSMDSWFLTFLPLVTFEPDGEIVGRLARSWEASDDRRTWTFHLRPDVKWHDGRPTTAHDVKFSIELSAHPAILFDDAWHDVDSIRVPDDTTLRIFYRRPRDARSTWMVYWPRHHLEGLDPEEFFTWDFWTEPVGNGSYRYVRHVPKTMVELEANPDFFAGEPAIDRLIIKFGPNRTAVTELLAGNVDIAHVNPVDVPKLAEDPRFRIYHDLHPDIPWLDALFWNHTHPALGDPRVRRALTHAIDRPEMLDLLNLPRDVRIVDVPFTARQYHRGTVPPPLSHDPSKARALLAAAGWEDRDGDGVRENGGEPLRFTALATPGIHRSMAIYVQSALRRVGVEMEVAVVENSLRRRRMRSGDFDAVFIGFYNHIDGHRRWLGGGRPYEAAGQGPPGSSGLPGWTNPRVARLLAAVKETARPSAVDSIYRELAPILLRELPITLLAPKLSIVAAHRRVRGLASPYRVTPERYMEHFRIEEEP